MPGDARAGLLLAALLAGLLAVTLSWTAIDRRPPEWDHANHLERAVHCSRLLGEGRAGLAAILAMSSFYPPVVGCAAGLLFRWLSPSPGAAQLVVWAYLALGALAVWGLGRRLLGAGAGLLAAFVFATAPFVVYSLTNFQLDLPLAAMVALALYLLLRAEHFAHRGWSLALGAALGAGMLTKPPFAVYFLPALAWSLTHALAAPDRRRRLVRAAGAVALAALLALPWYGPRLGGLPLQVLNRSFKQADEAGQAPALSAHSLGFYPRVFVPQFGPLAAPLALLGLWALRRRPAARGPVWAALSPLAVFWLIQNKNLRYTLPLLPAAALAAAAGWQALPAAARRVAAGVVVAVGLLQVSAAAFQLPPAPAVPGLLLPLVIGGAPDPRDWRHDELLAAIRRESGGRPVTVAVVANDNHFSTSNFRYAVVRDGLPFRVTRAWDGAPFGVDFALAKTGEQGPDHTSARPDRIMAAFAGGDPYLARAYPVIAEVALPDGSRGMVRARRLAAASMPADLLARRLDGAAAEWLGDFARDIEGLSLKLSYRPEALARGLVDRLELGAASALVGEHRRGRPALRLRDLRIVAEGLLFHPERLAETGVLEVLDLGRLRIERLSVTEADLAPFASAVRGLRGLAIRLPGPLAEVELRWPGPDLLARVAVEAPGPGGAPLALRPRAVRLGGLPVPDPLVDWIVRHLDPTARLARLPVEVWLAPVRVGAGRLEVGAGGG